MNFNRNISVPNKEKTYLHSFPERGEVEGEEKKEEEKKGESGMKS